MITLDLKDFLNILRMSLDLLYKNDYYLIEHSIHEQDISHRIAHYMENLLNNYEWYKKIPLNIDVEYNKNFDDSKKVFNNCFNCSEKKCYIKKEHYHISNYESDCKPDIIVHERESKNNIVVIEVKKNKKQCSEDFAKLSAFTCYNSDYKYGIGIYINIADIPSYILFKNGQKE